MKKILIFVTTLDGKVTKGDNPFVKSWSSRSDQEYFRNIWSSSSLIVMGSKTFILDPIKPSPARLLIVITSRPHEFSQFNVPGQIEFTDEKPTEIVSRLEKKGIGQMLIVGGPHLAASFLREKLIDELWLTIEPKIFGEGNDLVSGEKLDISLKLISCEKVNDEGTLITKYAVLKPSDLPRGA